MTSVFYWKSKGKQPSFQMNPWQTPNLKVIVQHEVEDTYCSLFIVEFHTSGNRTKPDSILLRAANIHTFYKESSETRSKLSTNNAICAPQANTRIYQWKASSFGDWIVVRDSEERNCSFRNRIIFYILLAWGYTWSDILHLPILSERRVIEAVRNISIFIDVRSYIAHVSHILNRSLNSWILQVNDNINKITSLFHRLQNWAFTSPRTETVVNLRVN